MRPTSGLRRTAISLFALGLLLFSPSARSQEIRLIIRADDFGMTEGSLEAVERSLNEGVVTATSILVPGPWFQGAAALCRRNPGWCTGVHLCAVGEWQGYRWRPVLPWSRVASMVDENGFLYASPSELFAHKPKLDEIDAEFRAQVALARRSGVSVQYIDTHYLSAAEYPGLEAVVTRIAADEHVPFSSHAGERSFPSIEKLPVEQKMAQAMKQIEALEPGLWLWFCHPGIDSPEQRALIHTAPEDIFLGGGVGAHRAEILRIMTSPDLRALLLKKGVVLTNYRDLQRRESPSR